MKIAIMGTGSIGGYFGGRLARAGEDVVFIARGAQLQALRERGLTVRSVFGDFHLPRVQATDDPAEVDPVDLILVCVKAYDTDTAALSIRTMISDTTIVISLQNGVDNHVRLIDALGPQHVLGGLCTISSAVAEPGVIEQVSQFASVIFGELDGRVTPRAGRILASFQNAGIETVLSASIQRDIWTKFLFIAAHGSMTAVTRSPVGPIRDTPSTWKMYIEAMHEVAAVARAKGIDLGPDAVRKQLDFVREMAPGIKSSMLVDVERGNPLEVETFSGTVIRLGRELNVPTPVHRCIYAILKVEDAQNRARRAEQSVVL
ncbi:Ketopantoate reductase PanE/ApbA [uncultured archaeon]|nr:Ketopantoate reductase PanE/ApbA [uncultured archaeon]